MKMIWCDLKINENYHVLEISFLEIFTLKRLVVGKLSVFSGMKNDVLMHRGGLKG